MFRLQKLFTFYVLGWLVAGIPAGGAVKATRKHREGATNGAVILWTNPVNIESRDLFYGPGGRDHVPRGTFTFVKEDLHGRSPKFVVKDQDGVKWKVKLGIEARPETAASRIVWAVGYYANEDYFVHQLRVRGMPMRLHRGQSLVASDGSVFDVRMKREPVDEKKIGGWRWRSEPFTGTRELNGLRTLMAVINNWDLKDENNAIYQPRTERIYAISDLGASFGCSGLCWPRYRMKGDLKKYSHSLFIRRLTEDTVSFQTPARPRFMFLVNPKEYLSRVRLEWIGRRVPRTDAKWMGTLLSRLTPEQIRDAFRAAGYAQPEVEEFANVLEGRIAALRDL